MPTSKSPLTIAICTHNRANLASECLSTILDQVETRSIDIVVIDNSSDEREARKLAKWSTQQPSIRYYSEARPGLSRARNRALALTQTEWIAFLDDDAVLRPGWVEAVLGYIGSAEPNTGAFGGPVFPRWPELTHADSVHPERLGRLWREFLSLTIPESLAIDNSPRVLGCNMVLKTGAASELGGFSEALGRTPSSLQGGEEIELLRRMSQTHYRIGFETNACIDHVIHPERLTRAWIRKRVLDEGRASSRFRRDALFLAQQLLALPPLAAAALFIGLSDSSQVNSHDNYVRFWRNCGYVLGLTYNTLRNATGHQKAGSTLSILSTATLSALLTSPPPWS